MIEADVVRVFTAWLQRDGWTVQASPDKWADVYAVRGDERLCAEAKGVTKDPGTAADILWGQLLRRMNELGISGMRYGIVVPAAIQHHALRVPAIVRQRLAVDVFSVTDEGTVTLVTAQIPKDRVSG